MRPKSAWSLDFSRGERNGLGRREKRPKKNRKEGERKQKNREKGEPEHKKGEGRMFSKKCDMNVQGLTDPQMRAALATNCKLKCI